MLHFYRMAGILMADLEKKESLILCEKRASSPFLKSHIFSPIHMEVKENAQEQSIMVGQSKNGALWMSIYKWLTGFLEFIIHN